MQAKKMGVMELMLEPADRVEILQTPSINRRLEIFILQVPVLVRVCVGQQVLEETDLLFVEPSWVRLKHLDAAAYRFRKVTENAWIVHFIDISQGHRLHPEILDVYFSWHSRVLTMA